MPRRPRELRIAFAMGGGVSLGTFSGAALAEVLKLTVLGARAKDGSPYDRVVVDVFSGASAGAMALGVMLRCLAQRTTAQEAEAVARLHAEYGQARIDQLPQSVRESLVAAQVVQDVQARVWGHDISLKRLLGDDGATRRDLRYEPSILDRGAVEAIAAATMGFPDGVDFDNRRLLGDRVLFACTLSNITATIFDARRDLNAVDFADLGLADGMISRSHRDLRVFDLNFREVKPNSTRRADVYPARWCRYHEEDEDNGRIGDLRRPRTWARIAATAIAAGAFPFAFGPVVLKRKRYEFGDDLWPQQLRDAGMDEYPFSYIDGGAFNNEPIREAFRLAAVMDAVRPNAGDRLVVFVDPKVENPAVHFRAPIHREYALQDPNFFGSLDGWGLVRKPSLDRLLPHFGSIAAMITSEATVIEGDKVFRTRKRFGLRDQIRDFVEGALTPRPDSTQLQTLRSFIEHALAEEAAKAQLPAGTLTLRQELERVIHEEPALAPLDGRVGEYLKLGDPSGDPDARLWLRALIFIAVDLAMDLEGKHPNSRLLAIAPVRTVNGKREIVALPGGRIAGFGGFCSTIPGRYEMAFARQCAREFLEQCDIIPRDPAPPAPVEFTPEEEKAYVAELKVGLDLLGERIAWMVKQSKLLNIPLLSNAILHIVAGLIEKKVRQLGGEAVALQRYELRIEVPDGRFELDGRGIGDRDMSAVRVGLKWHIITLLDYDAARCRWSGPFIDSERQTLTIDRDGRGPLPDRAFCTIALPEPAQCEPAVWCPNPIFTAAITEQDGGATIPASRWDAVSPGVAGLEDLLAM